MSPFMVRHDVLSAFVASLFAAKGMSDEDAKKIGDILVWADLRGVETHGIVRVPRYLDMIDQDVIDPRAVPQVRKERPGALLLDAKRAAGPVAMMMAADLAVGKARESGVGLTLVARTTHTAALGFYARRVTSAGCICMAMSSSTPNMAYHGTRDAAVATSPLCMGVPSGAGGALVLDMATSVVSLGKLMLARRTGQGLVPGWAIDADGNPTIDPRKAFLPLPMAGPKGAGLSLMVEFITGLLTDHPILGDVLSGGSERHRQNAMVLAIDIGSFVEPSRFRANVDALAAMITAMPRQRGFDAILMPGERGDKVMNARLSAGVAVPEPVLQDLRTLGRKLGVETI